ncbi:histone-lysine N-methyltransferase SETD1B-like [Senna tora]|uniref:Histone-lysine N-methyltransferase SETD1B-like n=1 Tax=Senna tora TaxID=362788 RepID=A0A834TJ24_9FABA|nr:histone-lysine N-methyltransferase SETD1B-like [Senna tora]
MASLKAATVKPPPCFPPPMGRREVAPLSRTSSPFVSKNDVYWVSESEDKETGEEDDDGGEIEEEERGSEFSEDEARWIFFRSSEFEPGCDGGMTHQNQRWVHMPLTICEALRAFVAEFSCLFPCRSTYCGREKEKAEKREGPGGGKSREGSCGATFARCPCWAEAKKRRRIFNNRREKMKEKGDIYWKSRETGSLALSVDGRAELDMDCGPHYRRRSEEKTKNANISRKNDLKATKSGVLNLELLLSNPKQLKASKNQNNMRNNEEKDLERKLLED